MKLSELQQKLLEGQKIYKGIFDRTSGKSYMRGENPFMDMQMDNYILCPADVENWYGFVKANYELIPK